MDSLNVPIFVQEIINSFWMLYGSSETSISFIDYATCFVNAVDYGIKVPIEGSYGVAISLAERFLSYGGEIRLNNEVTNIIIKDGESFSLKEHNTVDSVFEDVMKFKVSGFDDNTHEYLLKTNPNINQGSKILFPKNK